MSPAAEAAHLRAGLGRARDIYPNSVGIALGAAALLANLSVRRVAASMRRRAESLSKPGVGGTVGAVGGTGTGTNGDALSPLARTLRFRLLLLLWGAGLGLGASLAGLQQVTGVLVAKILSSGGGGAGAGAGGAGAGAGGGLGGVVGGPGGLGLGSAAGGFRDPGPVQAVRAIDILLVQAGVNAASAHFVALAAGMAMWRWVGRLERGGRRRRQ